MSTDERAIPPLPRGPVGLREGEEPYTSECPRCGYPETQDLGPYDYQPEYDDVLGEPPDPAIHCMVCGRCSKPFDAGPPEAADRHRLFNEEAQRNRQGRHE